jgi:AcrR family transcriptional regulator
MPPRRQRGRPSRIDATSIADAVLDIGIADATMRDVAERLGVSLPGLYHHVKGRDDLLRLAAARAVELAVRPVYDGQPWDRWLREWATFIRTVFGDQPELLTHYLSGAIEDEQMAIISDVLDVLRHLGVAPEDALRIFSAVTNLALGDALYATREASLARQARPWTARLFSFAATEAPEAHETLRRLGIDGAQPCTQEAFDTQFDLLVLGIAARHGLTTEDHP